MALTQVTGPYPIFTDLDGSPLDDGYLYIGAINEDPETNPIQVFWDSDLTIPATQPIRTNSGYAWRNGTPALLYTAGEFSITIRNKRQEFVLYSPVGYGFDPAAVSASVVKNDFIGDGVEVDFTLSSAPSTILATNVFINGVYQEKDSYSLSGNVITFSIAPPLNSSIEVMTNETGVINSGNATAISYTASFPGAVQQTVQTRLEQYVSVKDFGAVGDGVTDDTAAIQAAIDSGAVQVTIGATCYVTSVLNLAANQRLDFAGGKLVTSAGFNTTSGVLSGSAKAGVVIYGANIDATATSGVTGIRLSNCPNAEVSTFRLASCNLELYGPNNTTSMNYVVSDGVVNGNGWANTLVYVSNVYKASFNDIVAFDGIEGFGVYHAARHVKYVNCEAYNHTRDGFVLIEGQKIAYVNCISYSNSQSGFTTQRLTAGTDVQRVSYSGCHSYDNTFDGFDIRGSSGSAFGVNMLVTCDGCIATGNSGAGFYIVKAEGTTLSGCVTAQNGYPGISVDQSDNVLLTGCRSASNANSVSPSTAKAGILFQSCSNSGAVGCLSSNSIGITQHYGISFTGATTDNWISGGNYLNNYVMPAQLGDTGTEVYVTGAAIQDVANVYPDSVTAHTGVFSETGFGVPTHTRPKSSMFRRINAGGNGEVYVSNGGGSWYLLS